MVERYILVTTVDSKLVDVSGPVVVAGEVVTTVLSGVPKKTN
jgi:ligand-binding sensor protein